MKMNLLSSLFQNLSVGPPVVIRRPFDRILIGYLDTEGCPHIASPLRQIFATLTHVQTVQEGKTLSIKPIGPHYVSWINSSKTDAGAHAASAVNDNIIPSLLVATQTDAIIFVAWNAPHDEAVFRTSGLMQSGKVFFMDALRMVRRDCKADAGIRDRAKPQYGLALSNVAERLGVCVKHQTSSRSKYHEAIFDTFVLKGVLEALYGEDCFRHKSVQKELENARIKKQRRPQQRQRRGAIAKATAAALREFDDKQDSR